MSICPRRCSVFSMMPPGLCSTGRKCMDLVRYRICLHIEKNLACKTSTPPCHVSCSSRISEPTPSMTRATFQALHA